MFGWSEKEKQKRALYELLTVYLRSYPGGMSALYKRVPAIKWAADSPILASKGVEKSALAITTNVLTWMISELSPAERAKVLAELESFDWDAAIEPYLKWTYEKGPDPFKHLMNESRVVCSVIMPFFFLKTRELKDLYRFELDVDCALRGTWAKDLDPAARFTTVFDNAHGAKDRPRTFGEAISEHRE